MYGEQEVCKQAEPDDEPTKQSEQTIEAGALRDFGEVWNPNELKLLDRVKQIKRQKLLHEGDTLTKQDFIGFSKTTSLKRAKDEDYLNEEGVEIQR